MEVLQCFTSTRISRPSPNGDLIASIEKSNLKIYSAIDGSILHSQQLDVDFASRCRFIRWFQHRCRGTQIVNESTRDSGERRVLIADDDTIQVFDAQDHQYHARINGASGTTGKIANVEFGHTADEVLVFSDFGIKMTLWSLASGRGVEIKDPKSARYGYSFRPGTGHLAVLLRPETRDTVMVLAPKAQELEYSSTLQTIDAQGIQWSHDGKWLVIWDAESAGLAFHVYTANGSLFKTYLGYQDADNPSLGVNKVEWDPSAAYLAVGSNKHEIALLKSPQFGLTATFRHQATITTPNGFIWQEQDDPSQGRSYVPAPQPASPPANKNKTHLKEGITQLAFNSDGSLLASLSDLTPTTVWIWSPRTLTLFTVLIHHSPVKFFCWHPTKPELLMIQCMANDPLLHFWSAKWDTPRILHVPVGQIGGRMEAAWIPTLDEKRTTFLFGNLRIRALCRILNDGETLHSSFMPSRLPPMSATRFSERGPEGMFDEGNSMDLSPVRLSTGTFTRAINFGEDMCLMEENSEIDDTFDFKKHPVRTT